MDGPPSREIPFNLTTTKDRASAKATRAGNFVAQSPIESANCSYYVPITATAVCDLKTE
jgi:hypothetical protein